MKNLVRILALCILTMPALGQRVTAEAKVRIDGRVQRVRKINGRWWSDDNRQLTPAKDGFIWWISSEKGKSWAFNHHRPVNLEMAESLHLFMDPSAAQSLLGQPNEASDREDTGSRLWMYYAENGTALFVRFIHDELTDAKYQRPDYGVSGRPVQSVAQDLGGRDVFKIMADRAWQRNSPAEYQKFHGQTQRGQATTTTVASAGTLSARPDPPKRRISAELIDSVKVGMTRSEVVRILGEPSGGLQITGESDFEVMAYPVDRGGDVSLRIEKGKVARITR
jgi:hypothetical protein